jgi:hypothetical protein
MKTWLLTCGAAAALAMAILDIVEIYSQSHPSNRKPGKAVQESFVCSDPKDLGSDYSLGKRRWHPC